MKILQVIHSLDPQAGGTTEGLKQLSAALVRQGVTVEVMCLDAPTSPWLRDFPLPLFALGPGRSGYGFSRRVVPWLVKHGAAYDLMIVNGLWQFGSFAVWLAAQKTGLRYCVFPHGMLDPWFKRQYPLKHLKKWLYWPWGEYRVLRDAAAVFFTSEEERREAGKSFWLYRCHGEVVGFGIDRPAVNPEAVRTTFFEKHPQLLGKRLFLFLGRMHEKKGCDLVLQAFRGMLSPLAPQKFSDLHLVMAGPEDNAYAAEMVQLTRTLALEKQVTWTGMLMGDLKWGAFHAAEAFILPSHQENFGVSVVEALACGCPVLISNKVNIWREIQAETAGLVENDDLPGTTRLFNQWTQMSPVEQAAYRAGALACFEKRFTINGVAKDLVKTLEGLSLEEGR